jgi:DNA-binding LacI/PurR family transcriptional regulator
MTRACPRVARRSRHPEDISVIGIDDHPVAELTDPITTLRLVCGR